MTQHDASDLTGKVIGQWTVIRSAGRTAKGHLLYECRCGGCGGDYLVRADGLIHGKTTRCKDCAKASRGSGKLLQLDPGVVRTYLAGHTAKETYEHFAVSKTAFYHYLAAAGIPAPGYRRQPAGGKKPFAGKKPSGSASDPSRVALVPWAPPGSIAAQPAAVWPYTAAAYLGRVRSYACLCETVKQGGAHGEDSHKSGAA